MEQGRLAASHMVFRFLRAHAGAVSYGIYTIPEIPWSARPRNINVDRVPYEWESQNTLNLQEYDAR